MKILAKETKLYCRHCTPADKYVEPPPGPDHFDLEFRIHKRVSEFLETEGKFLGQGMRPLPYIEDGFITAPLTASWYSLGSSLVCHTTQPYGLFIDTGILYRVFVVDKLENISQINELIDIIKTISLFRIYWTDEENKIIEIRDKLGKTKKDKLEKQKLEKLIFQNQ